MVSLKAHQIALLSCLASVSTILHSAEAFVPCSKTASFSSLPMAQQYDADTSRREVFTKTATTFVSIAVAALGVNPDAAIAATKAPSPEELQRIKTGYDRMTYLLDNWEKETTTCKSNGGECKRDAEPVRRYMGLRSTTDPLFQIEKVFAKVKYMELDTDNLEPFFEAAEDWNAAVTMSNSMAFISQFGEYNPGGGKDEVLKYLDETQKQVILARTALEKVIKTLSL